jgi:single-strand DNA-binding protein
MASNGLNKASLIGNLTKDPEIRFTQGGQAVANFVVATNESWTGKDGNTTEKTEFHNISCWGGLAKACGDYLKKGSRVYAEGRITYRKVEKPDGQTKYYTEIVAREVLFLTSPKDRPQGERGAPVDDGFGAPPAPFPSDDMPF